MPLHFIKADITTLETEAIVNAANNSLLMGGGVCGAIFRAAGSAYLQVECDKIGHCDTGDAVITGGGALKAKHVIHTAGPVWQGGACGEREKLYSSYARSLELAKEHGLTSIAFPLISSGIYGYPRREAFMVAVRAITDFLRENEMDVYLAIFDAGRLLRGDLAPVESYVDDRLNSKQLFTTVDIDADHESEKTTEYDMAPGPVGQTGTKACSLCEAGRKKELDALLERRKETFTQMLLRYIDASGMTDPEVYRRANIDRKLFSKIRSNPDYKPSKNTVLAFCVALELNTVLTAALLKTAGYALSNANRFDIIVEYFIVNGAYDIYEINAALYAFGESQLGA